ncbi:MAG: hypothetical protein MUP21_03245 [Dehalococcoidia bacterium]|nr:hypothetical protein [Dehalococcoidia bacterium]
MKQKTIDNVSLVFDPGEQDTAYVIGGACERAIQLAQEMWGLGSPDDCRIYVMTSWPGFVFRSAPWSWRILLGATIPFWVFRVRRTWPYSAAWTQRYGRGIAIGVKPPRLLAQSDRSIGVRIVGEEKDMKVNVLHVTCHELVHACSAHLCLPMWLNEGIATVTVDRFLGKPTMRWETLALMRDFMPKTAPPTYRKLSRMGLETIAYQGIRGYWLVQYLEGKRPGFLRRIFSQGQSAKTIEREVAIALGMEPESFWSEIDEVVVDHFESKGERTP